jgi:hypothetical protein
MGWPSLRQPHKGNTVKKMTLQEIQEALASLESEGLIRDSGRRCGGKIVWVAVPPDDYTGKPLPRFDNGELDDELS